MFKKTSSNLKIITLLSAIVIVSIIHISLSYNFDKKKESTGNSIKLIERNNILLKEIIILIERTQSSEYNPNTEQISNNANLFEYSLSLLITGGKSTKFKNNFEIEPPDNKTKNEIKDIEIYWSEIIIKLNNLLKGQASDTKYNFNVIENISSKIQNKHNNLISIYQYRQSNYNLFKSILNILAVIIYLILIIILYLIIKKVFLNPVNSIEDVIDKITDGKTNIEIETEDNYEFVEVYSKLNKLNYKISEISDFVNHLVKDNYEIRFKDYNKHNVLELSLVKLRDKLKENIGLNKNRQKEEQLRQWFADGQAKFNDILRESSSSMKTLAEASLKNLVKFFNAAQGGFFIFNDNVQPQQLELISAFAYDRIKVITKTITLGDGLIGTCALEKNTIWLNNVPEGYMEIESGLGEAPPSNILIVPIKTDERLLGVIEIASFNDFNKNEVQFIESIAEDIASTLETTKISDQTSDLLEESKKKSDELAVRDSEMSDKIDELREAQKETKRSETEMSSLITAVDKVLYKLELSTTGRIMSANNLFLNNTGFNFDELKRKNFFDLLDKPDKKEIDNILNRIKNKESFQKNLTLVSKQSSKIRISSLFSVITNEANKVIRILFLGDNINYKDELEKKNETLINEMQYKTKLINEKEIELSENLTQLKNQPKKSDPDYKNLLEREKQIKQKFESEIDKKYFKWIKNISS